MSKFALLFLLIYIFGLLSTIAVGPVWGFYLYELVYFLSPANRWWSGDIPQISYSFYAVLVMLGMFVLKYKQQQQISLYEIPEAKWIAIIVLCYVITIPIAANPEINNLFLSNFLVNTWIVAYVSFRLLDSEKKIELALVFFMIGAAYIGYEAMMVGRDAAGRVEGIGTVDSPEANTISASILPVLPFVLYLGWQGSLKLKIVAVISGLLIVNGLILINSRGAFLGAVVASGYFFLVMVFSKYQLPKQRIFVVLLILAGISMSIRLVDDTFVSRMMTLETQASADSEGSGGRRINFWLATFDMVRDHPFGTGVFGYETLSRDYLKDESYFYNAKGGVRAVHSIWFQCLSEIGWLGFAAFMMLLYTMYKHLKQTKLILIKRKRYRQYYLIIAIEAGFLGFLTSSSFINMFRSEIFYWMLVFSVSACVVMHRSYGSEINKEK